MFDTWKGNKVKKSKIKIIKDKIDSNSYTFLKDVDSSNIPNSEAHLNGKTGENTGATDVDNLDKIYKKKKVLTNEDMTKASKGLKFSNPSQRIILPSMSN
jgi:hypothetical protein